MIPFRIFYITEDGCQSIFQSNNTTIYAVLKYFIMKTGENILLPSITQYCHFLEYCPTREKVFPPGFFPGGQYFANLENKCLIQIGMSFDDQNIL